jgi:hypothetical protein
MSDPVAELDQILPIAKALAEQDAKVIAIFWNTLRTEMDDDPYDVLQLTQEYLAQRLIGRGEGDED